MKIREMRPDEREPVLDLLERAFPGERDVFERYLDFDPSCGPGDFLLAFDGGRPVSCVQLFEKAIRLRGRTVRLGGIGSVGTHPDYRRKGLASELMRRQADAMRARDMPIGLLFTGRIGFYARLGWVQVPLRQLAVRAGDGGDAPPAGVLVRELATGDLDAVRALYDAYSAGIDGTTLRDARYWEGQLRYAGNPGETFRVAERDGRIVAYSRGVRLDAHCASEFARADDDAAADALAALLVGLCDEVRVRAPPDPPLERALEARARVTRSDDASPMWRVLDAPGLARLAGLPESSADRDILRALIDEPPAHYWLSDRF